MAAIIHQKDKRSGITYAYESVSYWDREKKQLLGEEDPDRQSGREDRRDRPNRRPRSQKG